MSDIPRKNYHTHTYRCKHAAGDAADYCREAVAAGLSVLGFSDHTPLPDGRWPGARMNLKELPAYCAALERARRDFPDLYVLKGMECEYAPEYTTFYREVLLGEYALDYLVGAGHYFPWRGGWRSTFRDADTPMALGAYADYLIETMRTGLFTFLAHPDVFGNAYLEWDAECAACSRAILAAAAELRVPLEINGYGLRKSKIDTAQGPRRRYPLINFWELAAEYPIKIVINSDAHRPQDVAASMDEAAAIARRFGLHCADFGFLEGK